MSADIVVYDLEFLNKPKTLISPNVAKTRLALNLKQIPFDLEWVNLLNIQDIIPKITKREGRAYVPVIIDKSNNNKVVVDSWDIALYLEEQYPDRPSLFNGQVGVHKFFHSYVEQHVVMPLYKLIIVDEGKIAGPQEYQDWFRKDRETRKGMTLEEFAGDYGENKEALKQALVPIRNALEQFPFITGDKPGWADILLASFFIFQANTNGDTFEDTVLNAFGPENNCIRSWWESMKVYM